MAGKTFDHKELFKVMPIPRFIIQAREDNSFMVSEANELALEYFDQSAQQVINKPIASFMDEENARHFEQSFEVCITKKVPVSIQALPTVPGGLRVTGFWVSPVLDEDGNVNFLDVVGQADVQDQSVLQRERDDAISLLTSVFEVSEVGIVVTDMNGQIIRVNNSFVRIYGWSKDELINTDILSLVTSNEREAARADREKFIQTGIRNTGEMTLIRKDGSIANTLFTTAALDLSQKRRFYVTTVMDITLRKQMEQSLRMAKEQADAANMAKSTFLANMSHELRTPLNAIIGFSEMIVKETFGELGHPKYTEYLSDIHMSAEHLLQIINEVLDMSKIESGHINLDEEVIDMADLIKSVVRMMESRAFGRDLTIDINISEGLQHMIADQRLIRQVLINLLANAVKFSKEGGVIQVEASMREDGDMELVVRDHGIGIPKNKIAQAMEPFGQVNEHGSQHQYTQGTGLGLPLAKAMVELHNGILTLISDTGKGTEVHIRFPVMRIVEKETT